MSEGREPIPDWIAEERRIIARNTITHAFEASIGLLKWVLTSVSIFHSTALIAGFNSDRFARIMFEGPAWAFLVGIALALGSGLALSFGAADYAGSLTSALWRGEGLDSEINEKYDPEPSREIYVGAILLGLSIAAFLLGIGFAAYEISASPTSQVPSS